MAEVKIEPYTHEEWVEMRDDTPSVEGMDAAHLTSGGWANYRLHRLYATLAAVEEDLAEARENAERYNADMMKVREQRDEAASIARSAQGRALAQERRAEAAELALAASQATVKELREELDGARAHLCQAVGRMTLDALEIEHKDHACADCGAEKPHEGFFCIRHKAARYLASCGCDEDDLFPNAVETPISGIALARTDAMGALEAFGVRACVDGLKEYGIDKSVEDVHAVAAAIVARLMRRAGEGEK